MLLDLAQIICKTSMYIYIYIYTHTHTHTHTHIHNDYIYIYIVIHSFIEFFRVWFLEQTVWSNNKVTEWMLSCAYSLVHTPIAASFCYFGLWLPVTSSLSLSIGAPHISCAFVCCCGAAQYTSRVISNVGGKQLQKCVKWLQLFVEMKLYTLCIFEWFKRLWEGHEDLEDDARWVAVSCPKSRQTVKVTNCWPETIKWHKNWWRINWALTRWVNRLFSKIWERGTYGVWQLSNEINFLLAVLAILQPTNTDSPSSISTCSGLALQCLSVE